MVQLPFDFRPNVQIGSQDFIRPTNPWGALFQGLNAAYQKKRGEALINEIASGVASGGVDPAQTDPSSLSKLLGIYMGQGGGQEQGLIGRILRSSRGGQPAPQTPPPTFGETGPYPSGNEPLPGMSIPPVPGQSQTPMASAPGMTQAASQSSGMPSPMMGPGVFNPAIVKPLLSLYGEKALPFIGKMMYPSKSKSTQTYQAVVGADGSVRPFTGTEQLKPGEKVIDLPGASYTGAMTKQAQRKEAIDRYEAMMSQKTSQAMLPFEGAEKTLRKYKDLYIKANEAKEVGPGIGRIGGPAGAIVGGKKFSKLFEYKRTKQELLHTLATSLGVNRFNLAAMQQIASALPEGTEDYKQGISLIDAMIDSVHQRRDAAKRDLQYQGLILRGVMGLDAHGPGASSMGSERPADSYSDEELEHIASQGE